MILDVTRQTLTLYWLFTCVILSAARINNLIADVKSDKTSLDIGDVEELAKGGLLLGREEQTEFWLNLIKKYRDDFTGTIQASLEDSDWWQSWKSLHPATREEIVSFLLPFLINNADGWTIHCSDAYKLCQSDTSCAWKYWNYVRSCSSDDAPLEDWTRFSGWKENFSRSSTFLRRSTRSVGSKNKQHAKKSHRTSRRNRKRRKRKQKASALSPRGRRYAQSNWKVSWRRATKMMHFWMGKHWKNIYADHHSTADENCPSKCLNALLMLNRTIYGALLARCDCKAKYVNSNRSHKGWSKNQCLQHQNKALECRPRLFKPKNGVVGCTESRLRCENNRECNAAQQNFLLRCSQVINGVACTTECKDAMVLLASKSKHFNTCMCDGTEKPVCHKIRTNINKLCEKKRDCSKKQQWTSDGKAVISKNNDCATENNVLHPEMLVSSNVNMALATKSDRHFTVFLNIVIYYFMFLWH